MGKEITIHAQLIAESSEVGDYTTYVFKVLDEVPIEDLYIMCVKLPNWNSDVIDVGDTGFLHYKYVIAGKDKWYNRNFGEFYSYGYTQTYFIKFVSDAPKFQFNRLKQIQR